MLERCAYEAKFPSGAQVRLSVIYRLGELLQIVGIDCAVDDDPGMLLGMISALGEDPNWRVRHATLLLLPVLAEMLDPAAFSQVFVDNPSGAF